MAERKPRFKIEKLEGTRTRRVASPIVKLDDKGEKVLNKDGDPILLGGFDYEDLEVDAGWMIYFPSGSSIHVWSQEEMERQGFLEDPTMVNMDGESEINVDPFDYKAKAEQIGNRSRSSRAAQL